MQLLCVDSSAQPSYGVTAATHPSTTRKMSSLLSSRTGRDLQRWDGNTRLIVCVVPISKNGKHVLLISSSKYSEKWILPKGGWESDESQEECAKRELEEEAGVSFFLKTLLINCYTCP
jgi:hypothetical protein